MAKLVLWHHPQSPPSWTVRMVAKILGLELELREPDLTKWEQKSAEYRKMNPMGTFPVVKDGAFYISESHTIIKYLLEKYDGGHHSSLYPSDIQKRALVDQIMFFDAGVAFKRVRNIVFPTIYEGLQEVTSKLAADSEDVYHTVELYLDGKDYVATDEFTFADLSLGTSIITLNIVHPIDDSKYPQTAAWLDRLRAKEFFRDIAIAGSDSLSDVIKLMWEKNKAASIQTSKTYLY